MSVTVRLLIFALALGLFGAAHVYLYRRLVRDVFAHKKVRLGLLGALGGLSGFALVVRPLSRQGLGETLYGPVLLLSVWTGVLLYLLLFTLTLDAAQNARRLWGRRSEPVAPAEDRRRFLAQSMAVTSSVAAFGVSSYGLWTAFHPPEVTEVPIRLPGLPKALEGLTLVQLTDIHVGPLIQRRFMEALVGQVNRLKPDVVAITGDLVDGPVPVLGPYVQVLARLQSRYGSYFVTGNHEYYAGVGPWVEALSSMGLTVLRNRYVKIGEQASFDLIGVDDYGTMNRFSDYDLEKAVSGRDPERASVLLSHQPRNFEQVAQKGLGLMLSGHTHGGQMFPGTLVGSLIWGDRNAGLSRLNDSFLYTSRGCGFVGPPMRVGAPPEIVKVTLVPA